MAGDAGWARGKQTLAGPVVGDTDIDDDRVPNWRNGEKP